MINTVKNANNTLLTIISKQSPTPLLYIETIMEKSSRIFNSYAILTHLYAKYKTRFVIILTKPDVSFGIEREQ
jgi:hypothetical protein